MNEPPTEHLTESTQVFRFPESAFGETSSRRDMNRDTLPAATIRTTNAIGRLSFGSSSQSVHFPNRLHSTNETSRDQNDDRKKQFVSSKHAVRNLATSNDTSSTLDGQLTCPTREKVEDNPVLNYRKPPDSTKDSLDAFRSIENDERTTSTRLHDHAVPYQPEQKQNPQSLDLELEKLEEEFDKL